MTDAPIERKRKSTRFLLLLALAVVAIALIAWFASRDSNDGEATAVTETGVPVFESAPVETLGTGTTSRDLPGAPDYGDPSGAAPGGDGVTGTPPLPDAGATPGAATTETAPADSGQPG